MANEVQPRRGGIEGQLDGVGGFILFLSVVALVVSFVLSQDEAAKKLGLSSLWIVLGIGALAQGIIFWVLFRAGSEVIRLLKKLNHLPFGGSISEAEGGGSEYTCTDCGEPASEEAQFCTKCGSKFTE